MSDPDSIQKALPHPPEGFLVFFRSPASEGRRLGARLTIESSGTLVTHLSAYSWGAGGAEF